MIYLISSYIFIVVMIHVVLFTVANFASKILLINSAISCLVVAMLLSAFYFKDNNFIDVIFFYIIMSPIGFYGIFIYYKNVRLVMKNDEEKHDIDNNENEINCIRLEKQNQDEQG